MKFLYCIVVSLLALSASAAYGDEPKVPATHAGVFFKGAEGKNIGWADTYSGIEIRESEFREFLYWALGSNRTLEKIDSLSEQIFKPSLPYDQRLNNCREALCIKTIGDENANCHVIDIFFTSDEDSPHSGVLRIYVASAYNAKLQVEYSLKELQTHEQHEIETKQNIFKSEPLKWSARFSLEASTDLSRGEINQINGRSGSTGIRGTVETSYTGFPNPLAWLTKDHSYYDFSLDATLSELRLDEKSSIELSLGGISDWKPVRIKGFATIIGPKLATSQSFNRIDGLYDLRYRAGDKRVTGKGYFSIDDVLKGLYFEWGAQFGYSIDHHLNKTIKNGNQGWLVRPLLMLGVAKQKVGYAEISGTLSYIWLSKNLGRAVPENRWAEIFDVSIALGKENKQVTFSIKGGRNPGEGFIRVKPTFEIGIKIRD